MHIFSSLFAYFVCNPNFGRWASDYSSFTLKLSVEVPLVVCLRTLCSTLILEGGVPTIVLLR